MGDYHLNYDKTCGKVCVISYGGGSPRWVRIQFGEEEIHNLRPEDLKDLRYLIDDLLGRI